MLRTLFTVGLMALVGLFLLKLTFGILGGVLGLFFVLCILAVKILIIGGVANLALRLVAPSTPKRLRDRITGTPTY